MDTSRLEKRQCLCRISHREVFFLTHFPGNMFSRRPLFFINFSGNMEKWQALRAISTRLPPRPNSINNSVTVQHLPLANFNRPGAQPSPPRAPAPARTARCTSRATVTLRHYTTQRDRPRWQASLPRWLLAHHCALADARAQGSCQHDRDPADFQTTKGERFADRTRRFVRALPCRVARLACSHCTDSLPCSLPCCAGGKANRLIRARRDRVLWTRAPGVRAPL